MSQAKREARRPAPCPPMAEATCLSRAPSFSLQGSLAEVAREQGGLGCRGTLGLGAPLKEPTHKEAWVMEPLGPSGVRWSEGAGRGPKGTRQKHQERPSELVST